MNDDMILIITLPILSLFAAYGLIRFVYFMYHYVKDWYRKWRENGK